MLQFFDNKIGNMGNIGDIGKELEVNSEKNLETFGNIIQMVQHYCTGFSKYASEFTVPYLLATIYFSGVEQKRLLKSPPLESFKSYMDLLSFNLNLFNRGFQSSMKALNSYNQFEMGNAIAAVFNTFFPYLCKEGETLDAYIARQARLIKMLAEDYPEEIENIEPEYGFHFERGHHELVAETDRFYLYQVAPVDEKTRIDKNKKPILIIPPFVLGANILAFLPEEGRSYAHCFSNMGIPTYIRIMKDIETTEALQVMTPEDDCLDTKYFCEKIVERNAKPVTLNGYCQGGYMAVCDYLSGELDDVVDALITCVSPMDGTRSHGLARFLNTLPQRFNDLSYGMKKLPNGNLVADGKLMGWVYKLKSIEHESPIVAYYRDLMMFGRQAKVREPKVSKSAAAINYWLNNERTDLPPAITKMSFDSYNIPVTEDGTLPVTMFGKSLNFKHVEERGTPWLICYGINDDLVEQQTALAPLDYIKADVAAFPKGHVAIATSWSLPTSECSLNSCFGEGCTGPVKYHMDLDEDIETAVSAKSIKKESVKKAEKAKESSESKPSNTAAESKAKTEKKSAKSASSRKKSAKKSV